VARIVLFGEIMLRLSTPGHERIGWAGSFEAAYGGAEANTAASLAAFGHEVVFVTRLPENSLGDSALRVLRAAGINTEHVIRGGTRLGLYFLEHGASVRPSRVLYDRRSSAFSELQPGGIDWKRILHGAQWFHMTGITPALSPGCARHSLKALEDAVDSGVCSSIDLNYRKKLWSADVAAEMMRAVIRSANLLISNEEDPGLLFGIEPARSDIAAGAIDREEYAGTARRLAEFANAPAVAITLRKSCSASDNGWSGLLLKDGEVRFSREYDLHIVDRVGGGDAFAAGLIHGFLNGWDAQRTVDFAAAASALKHTVPGDFNAVSEAEVIELMEGGPGGRVRR